MTTTKVRVYEVARELGMDNRELMNRFAALGIPVRNHMTALEPAEVDRVKRALEKDKAQNTVEERIRPTVVRRRTNAAAPVEVAPPAPRAEARQENGHAAPPVAAAPRTPAPAPVARVETIEEAPARPAPVAAPRVEAVETVRSAEALPPPPPREVAMAVEVVAPPPPRTPSPMPVMAAPREEQPQHREVSHVRPSQPPPASIRLAHSNLPPGVIARGNVTAPSAPTPSAATVSKIVSQHAQQMQRTSYVPDGVARRRVEVQRSSLGPTGRPMPGQRPGSKRRPLPGKKGMKTEITTPSAQKRIIRIEDNIPLQGLAQKMSLKATDVLMKLIQMGMGGVNINSTLDSDTAKLLAGEFGYEVENVARSDDELVNEARGNLQVIESELIARAPIVTVMGHVDHGKTSLLDRIRKQNVAGGEAGGITQHIGAYRVESARGAIVFLDTPGHEAFTAMRARGAQATDVVVLVVAADDGVMPQTREAIAHARSAEVPIIVAVNKMDKPGARPDQIRQELSGLGLQPEEWGGTTLFQNISAMTGEGVDQLLESIALQTEIMELRANPNVPAEGVVLEAYLDKGRGAVANVLVQNGTLKQGDMMLAGVAYGRIRALTDETGARLKTAGPATPVEVLGLPDLPQAGDSFYIVTDQKKAQELVDARKKSVAAKAKTTSAKGLEDLYKMMAAGELKELNLVIKSDVSGSMEALVKALTEISTAKVKVNVIHTGVGGITENDVMLASASKAIIIGFSVRPAGQAAAVAKAEGVEIRMYSIIYEAVDDVKKAMAGLLAPEFRKKELGKAQVRKVFSMPKSGTIAGCYVTDGAIKRNGKARLVRDAVQIWEGSIASLRRVKDDVKEVTNGFECGIALEGYNDIHENDMIECYELEQIAAQL